MAAKTDHFEGRSEQLNFFFETSLAVLDKYFKSRHDIFLILTN